MLFPRNYSGLVEFILGEKYFFLDKYKSFTFDNFRLWTNESMNENLYLTLNKYKIATS